MEMSEKNGKSGMKSVVCQFFIENSVFVSPTFYDIFLSSPF